MVDVAAAQQPAAGGERYDVFISYSRKDGGFVAALERTLESYRAPRSLPIEHRRLRVFRDAQDLTGPEYGDSIRDNLRRAARLLVVCSPRARQSAFVDQEIEWFLETHDRRDVISLLLDGSPNNEVDATDARRAFPAQLCKAHAIPLAADYRGFELARHKLARPPYDGAWYTLLANVYGIDRNTVEQRDRLRQRRERRIASAIAGAVIVGLAAAAVFSWVQMRRAEEQRDVAVRGFARYLAMESQRVRPTNPDTGLLLAVEATRTTFDLDGTLTPEAETALRGALADVGGVSLGIGTRGLAFSGDGRWLARIEDEGTITAWDLQAPESQPAAITLPGTQLGWLTPGPAHQLAVLTRDRDRAALFDLRELSAAPRWIAARAGKVQHLEFSRDGAALMMLDGGPDIVVLSVPDPNASPILLGGHTPMRIGAEARVVKAAAFGSTGRWIASTGWDDTVRLWDRNAGGPALTLLTGVASDSPRFSADDRWLLVSASGGESGSAPYRLWYLDAPTPQPVAMELAEAPREASGDAPASADWPRSDLAGDRLILGERGETLVWRLSPTGARLERRVPGTLAALGGDRRHFATVRAGTDSARLISLWDVEAAEAEGEVEVAETPHAVGYSAAGRRLIALTEGELRSWQLDGGDSDWRAQRYAGAFGNQLMLSVDGRAAVVGNWYSTARLLSLGNPSLDPIRLESVGEDYELTSEIRGGSSSSSSSGRPFGGMPQMLAFDAASRRLAVPRDGGGVDIVDLQHPNRRPATIRVGDLGVSATAFSPDGQLFAAGDQDLSVRVWRAAESAPFAHWRVPAGEGARSSISALVFSRSGKYLAAGGAFGNVAVWDVARPEVEPIALAPHADWVTSLEFSADDRLLLIGSADGKASVVLLAEPSSPRLLEGHQGVVKAAFTAQDRFIVTIGLDATLRVWPVHDAKAEPRILRGHRAEITTFAVAPLSQRLVTASEDGFLRVWNLDAAVELEAQVPLWAPLAVVTVSQDGQWLAVGDMEGAVRILRLDSIAQQAVELPAAVDHRSESRGEVFALRFSPDGRWLAALTTGAGRLWRMRPEELMRLACAASGRNLEVDEWEVFLTDLDYRLTCPEWGLGPQYLAYARREAERGLVDRAVRLLTRAKALAPELPFDPVAEGTRIGATAALERGRSLARDGRVEAALAELGSVRNMNPQSALDPAQEVERVRQAEALVALAKNLSVRGELEPAIAKFREALELDPGLGIDPVADAGKFHAPELVRQGHALAAEGRMAEAVELLERAVLLDPTAVSGAPEASARNVRAHELKNQADRLAEEGQLEAAIAGYRAALAVDGAIRIDPEIEAGRRVAAYWLQEAYRGTELPAAIELFEQARALDPTIAVRSISANELCWRAVQRNLARRAMGVCDAAVAADEENWMARDSRAVARALVGDTAGAIEDFEVYVKSSDRDESVAQRERWIARLKTGWRPSSFAELDGT